MSGVIGEYGTKSRELKTKRVRDSRGGTSGLTAEGHEGAFLDLIDRAGATNEKWIRLMNDGGAFKFQQLYDNASDYMQNPSVQIDSTDGWLGIGPKARFWSGHLSGSNDTNRRVPTRGCSAGFLVTGGFGYGYAARGMWVWSYGTSSAQFISHMYKSNGWGNTVNNPSLQSGYLQCDGTVISSSYGGASWGVWGIN